MAGIATENKKRREKVTLKKRDQAKTGAGMPEVKPITMLEEKILATMGQVYTQGISTGTEVGLPEEILENVSAEVSDSTEEVILTLMEAECDSRAKKKKHLSLQEELLELEKEKLLSVALLVPIRALPPRTASAHAREDTSSRRKKARTESGGRGNHGRGMKGRGRGFPQHKNNQIHQANKLWRQRKQAEEVLLQQPEKEQALLEAAEAEAGGAVV
ncbi:unnamed protein product [Boreogadus saida]